MEPLKRKQASHVRTERNGHPVLLERLNECYKFTNGTWHNLSSIRDHCKGSSELYQVLVAHGVLKKNGRNYTWDTIAPNPFMARKVLHDFLEAKKTVRALREAGQNLGRNGMIELIRVGSNGALVRSEEKPAEKGVTMKEYQAAVQHAESFASKRQRSIEFMSERKEKKKGIFHKLWIWLFGE